MSDNNTNVENVAVETLLEDIAKSLQAQNDNQSVEIISKGADQIVQQNKELADSIEKSVNSLNEKLDSLLEKVSAFDTRIEKSLNDIATQPLPAKAVTSEAEVAPAEVKAVEPVITKAEVLSKALNALQDTQDHNRVAELRKGIARLESNFAPADIARDLNL